MFKKNFSERQLFILELLITLTFCFVPLLFNNPYRLNIFLSWEGAYRLYLGQMPFRDFALPMGYGYWVIPALFFKIFGPYMYSLIIAQVFINLMAVFSFRGILKTLQVRPVIILLSVLVFCFSYVSFNFWPWYNHLVIVLELVAIFFVLFGLFETTLWKVLTSLALSAFFILFSIFTKQDGGALGLMLIYGILTYDAWVERSIKKWLFFTGFFIGFCLIVILPLLPYDFTYWFNYGQLPHDSRLVLMDFLNQIVGWSYWEKFFLLIIVLIILDKARKGNDFFRNKQEFLFAFICLAIVLEAMIIQVTSDEPPNGEVFFYAFGFAFLLSHVKLSIDLTHWRYLGACIILIVFWWTGIYWRNIKRVIAHKPVVLEKAAKRTTHKYRLAKEFKTLEKLYLAESTLEGIKKIKALDVFKNKKDAKVLNMSELTSLAYEVPFTPLTGQPMWFHQGVSIFQKEVDEFCMKIKNLEYDVVIFETIPTDEVINFYPMDVKACLEKYYRHEFTFLAPRTPEESFIDVYTKPTHDQD